MELIAPESAQVVRTGVFGGGGGHGQTGRFREVLGDKDALRHVHVAGRLGAGLELPKRLAQDGGNLLASEKRTRVKGAARVSLCLSLSLCLCLRLVLVAAEFCVLRRASGQPRQPERGAKHYPQCSKNFRA